MEQYFVMHFLRNVLQYRLTFRVGNIKVLPEQRNENASVRDAVIINQNCFNLLYDNTTTTYNNQVYFIKLS